MESIFISDKFLDSYLRWLCD